MYIVHVHLHVKPECIEPFKAASLENARNSLQEPGIARFDLLQQADDPTHFELIEVYRTPAGPLLNTKRLPTITNGANYASRCCPTAYAHGL